MILDDLIARIDRTLRGTPRSSDFEVRMEMEDLMLIQTFLLELRNRKRDDRTQGETAGARAERERAEQWRRTRDQVDEAFRASGIGGTVWEDIFKDAMGAGGFRAYKMWEDSSGNARSERVDPNDFFRYNFDDARKAYKPPPGKTKRPWHVVLGLRPTATRPEIIKAYRSLALRFHPDRKGPEANNEKMVEINVAKQEGLGGL